MTHWVLMKEQEVRGKDHNPFASTAQDGDSGAKKRDGAIAQDFMFECNLNLTD